MWQRITFPVTVVLLVAVNFCAAFNAEAYDCCDCTTMYPTELAPGVKPQVLPSPFVIKVAKTVGNRYTTGLDINVNLTAAFDGKAFRSFMIQAVRTDKTMNNKMPIGTFKSLDPNEASGIDICQSGFGASFVSTDFKEKRNVRLAWMPHRTFQGHIEFRATFIQDEKTFWVREKSEPLFDPNQDLPPEMPLRYIPAPIPTIDVSKCGINKGCYRIPEDCAEIECQYIFTWQNLGRTMEFEMSAITDGFNDRYFAIGLSEDIYMGKDLVFECVHNSTNGKVEVFQSFNVEDDNRNIRLQKPKSGIVSEEGSYNNGRLRCRFQREKAVNSEELADWSLLKQAWHIIMARGPALYGLIRMHGLTVGHLPVSSPDPVSLDINQDMTGRARYHLVKAHACLMLLAWIFFAPVGLLWMKYYTTMWPNSRFMGERYWLVAHFNCTFWVVLLVVIGIILIFVEAGGWSEFPTLPARAHPILGLIVFISVLLIPIIALIRCPEKHTCRPIGNWFYWLFWTIAFCLAIPNIFIGMEFGKAMVPWWLTWILCIFFLFSLVCEVILEVHQCCTHKKNKERRIKWEIQKKEHPNSHIPEPWPAGRNFKRNVLYTHFIVCLIVVIIAVITVAVS